MSTIRSLTIELDPEARQFFVRRHDAQGTLIQSETSGQWRTIHAVLSDLDHGLSNGNFDYRQTCKHCGGKGFRE